MITCQKTISINVVGIPPVDVYWKMDEAGGNVPRVDAIKGLVLSSINNPVSSVTGIINDGVLLPASVDQLFGDIFTPGGGTTWNHLNYSNANAGSSVSMWINFSGTNTNNTVTPNNTFTFQDAGGVIKEGVNIRADNGVASPPTLAVDFLKNFGATDQTLGPQNVVLNAWNHVAITYNQATHVGSFFLNGTLVGVVGLSTWVSATNAGLSIQHPGGLNSYFQMTVDEVAWWSNHVLSATEVNTLFNSGSARRPPNVP